MNKNLLVGRIIKMPKKNIFTIAVTRNYKNDEGIYETDFIPITTTEEIANNITKYCEIGDFIGIRGKTQTKNESLVIIAEKVIFLSRKDTK